MSGQDMFFRCSGCGIRLLPYISEDGTYVSLREQAERSERKYGWGIRLCRECERKYEC